MRSARILVSGVHPNNPSSLSQPISPRSPKNSVHNRHNTFYPFTSSHFDSHSIARLQTCPFLTQKTLRRIPFDPKPFPRPFAAFLRSLFVQSRFPPSTTEISIASSFHALIRLSLCLVNRCIPFVIDPTRFRSVSPPDCDQFAKLSIADRLYPSPFAFAFVPASSAAVSSSNKFVFIHNANPLHADSQRRGCTRFRSGRAQYASPILRTARDLVRPVCDHLRRRKEELRSLVPHFGRSRHLGGFTPVL